MVGSSILLATCLIAQASAPLVQISNPTVTPIADHSDIGTLDFDVTNRANQAVTAWEFESAARHVTRTNIQLVLDGKIPQPAVFLRNCIERLEASRAAYQSHSRPAQHGPGGR